VIRGIGSTTTDPGLEQSVALNIDGINAGRGLLGGLALFDTAQIEILKGPQALFFGKNSPAGVISVTSAGPTDQLSGYIRAGYEFEARERYVEAAIGGPVSDTLGVRLAVRGTEMDGWLNNTAPPKANPFQPAYPLPGAWSKRIPDKKNLLGRLTVQWNPTDKLDFTLKAFATRYRDNMSGAEQQAICPGPFPITFGVPDPDGDCKANGLQPISAAPAAIDATFPHAKGRPYTHFNAQLVSLNVNYEMENLTLTSATGYYHIYNDSFAANFEASTIGYIDAYNGERTDYVTQELRLASDFDGALNFSVGGYFEDGQRKAINDAQIAPVGPDPVTGKFQSAERIADVDSTAYSLFGQLRWEIMPDLELAGGARWTEESKKLRTFNSYVHSFLAPVFLPVGTVVQGKNKEDNVSPEVTLTWHPT
ncbi:MAG: TonB-dependent receptor, partial [Sphingomonadales bacterium]